MILQVVEWFFSFVVRLRRELKGAAQELDGLTNGFWNRPWSQNKALLILVGTLKLPILVDITIPLKLTHQNPCLVTWNLRLWKSHGIGWSGTPLKINSSPLRMMFGRQISCWDGNFPGCMSNSGGVVPTSNILIQLTKKNWAFPTKAKLAKSVEMVSQNLLDSHDDWVDTHTTPSYLVGIDSKVELFRRRCTGELPTPAATWFWKKTGA